MSVHKVVKIVKWFNLKFMSGCRGKLFFVSILNTSSDLNGFYVHDAQRREIISEWRDEVLAEPGCYSPNHGPAPPLTDGRDIQQRQRR